MTTFTIRVTSSAANAAGTGFGQQDDVGAPSFFDLHVTNSSNPLIADGVYDAYCIDPLFGINLSPTTFGADAYEASNPTSYQQLNPNVAPLSALTQMQVDQINWILAQNLTSDAKYGGQFNYGEVQTAIWHVLGYTQAQIDGVPLLARFLNDNNRNVVSANDVDFLVNGSHSAVTSGEYVSPPAGSNFAMLVDPASSSETAHSGIQPLIVQLTNAKLGNFVWFDSNANGLQDNGEAGVDNLVVELWKGGVKVASTITGDDFSTLAVEHGFYQFAGLAAGDYQVKFVAPDYQFTTPNVLANSQDALDSDANPADGFSQTVHLNAGDSNQTVDAGLIHANASLGDRIWVDTNGNGQQDDGATGIAGLTVTLIGGGSDGLISTAGDNTTATTTTGADGFYQFTALTPGVEYQVQFSKPVGSVYTGANIGNDVSDSDADVTTGKSQIVTLASGENNPTLDAGVYVPASLGDRIWVDTNGNGQQDDGATGVSGLTVTLIGGGADGVINGIGDTTATTTTGADGFYQFTGLTPGQQYQVQFSKPAGFGYTGANIGNDVSDSDADATGKRQVVTLSSGENNTTLDAGILQTASLGDRIWVDTNGNGQQDDGATGIAGLTVTLIGGGADGLISTAGDNTTATTTTGADGFYQFTALTPGVEYQVQFSKPVGSVYTGANIGNDVSDSDADTSTGKSQIVTLASGENNPTLDAGVYVPASLGDRIWVDTNGNGQQDDGATGIAGLTVTLIGGGADGVINGIGDTSATTTTGADGFYQFTGLTPGQQYQVQFSKPAGFGYTAANIGNDVSDSDADATGKSQVVTLSSGENNTTLDAGILQTASLGDRIWVDTNGNGQQDDGATGIAGMTVTLIGGGADGLISTAGDNTTATTTTGADGFYQFTALTPGVEYQVQFSKPVGSVYTGANIGNDVSDSDADVTTGKSQIVTLASGENNPTLDAGVYVPASLGDRIWVDTNGNGQQDDGATGVSGLTVTLIGGGADGVINGIGDTSATTTTGADGFYQFTGLTPGQQYQVQFSKPAGFGYTAANIGNDVSDSDADATGKSQVVTLSSGENNTTLDAGILQTASLGDRIWVDTNGNGQQDDGATGIAGLTVTLIGGGADGLISTAGDNTTATTTTGADGFYQFTALTPGVEYQVQFSKPVGSVYTGANIGNDVSDSDADVTTGKSQIVTLASGENNPTLDAGVYVPASLGDRIWVDTNGNGQQDDGATGVSGLTVTLIGGGADGVINGIGDTTATTTTGADGFYQFTGLTPGQQYQVQFSKPAGFGYTAANIGNDVSDSDADATGKSQVVTLSSGENNTTLDAGILQTASLGDRIWVDTNGNGQQDDGATGIAGLTVTLIGGGADGVINGIGDTTATTTTGADGFYQFTALTPGVEYQVQFSKPVGSVYTGANIGNDVSDSDADTSTGKSQIVTLTSGENNPTLDAGVYVPASLGDRIWVDTNGNGQQDDGATGIAGLTVTLIGGGADGVINGIGDTTATTTTGADGFYQFTGLTPGQQYQVQFSKPAGFGYTTANVGNDVSDSDADVTGKSQVVTLSSGENNTTLDAGILQTASLGDRLWVDTNHNGQQDDGATGLSGQTVTLIGGGADGLINGIGDTSATTTTGVDGFYQFTGLNVGEQYQVQFAQPAGYLFTKQNIGNDASDSDADISTGKSQIVTLASGENNPTLDAGVWQTASLGDRLWVDTNHNGQQDDGATGLSGQTVTLIGGGADGLINGIGDTSATTTTGVDGFYQFTGLNVGEQYQVQFAQPAGYLFTKQNIGNDASDSDADISTGKSQIVTLASGENNPTLDAGVWQTASLGDRIWVDSNGNGQQDDGATGISGLTVTLIGGGADGLINGIGDTSATTTTGADGIYHFTGLNVGEQYQVQFSKPVGSSYTSANVGNDASDSDADAAGKSQIVTLSSGQNNTTLDAGVVQTASIGNHVWLDCNANGIQDANEMGVAGVTVNLLSANGSVLATKTTDANGDYLFSGLNPGDYAVQFVPLAGYNFTTKDANGNASDTLDSDADVVTGKTVVTTLSSGEVDLSWDAGLTPVCRPVTFDFSGNSASCGTYGNARTYTDALTGVSVTARAFSQDKGTDNWQNAFLGSYAGGLGVTDTSEGTGANNTHTIDNVGRNNYIVLQFSQAVLVDKAFLGYVVGDSDAQIWVGNAGSPITSMHNSVLNGALLSEVNTTTLTTARWADFNAAGVRGNLFIIAADTTDTTPEDYFKLQQVSVCAPDYCAPVAKASLGDFVWEDKNFNGIQDSGEAGIGNVTVKLLSSTGTLLASTTTDASGAYHFTNLNPGDYKVQVVAPSGYYVTKANVGSDTLDSDIDSSGTSAVVNLTAGENDTTVDAGLYRKVSVGDKVWEDTNHNWVQDGNDPGIGGVKVALMDATGTTVLQTTTTNTAGNYLFADLDPGTYVLRFDKGGVLYHNIYMDNWKWAVKDVGTNDAIDSDVAGNGTSTTNVTKTDAFTLVSGQNDMTRDAAITPIVLDLDHNGINTVSRAESTGTFDLFGTGKAVASGWLSSGDGFLAVDKNGNGHIDNISELFGGITKGAGFANLAAYDSNHDGMVDKSDAHFADLLIWRDANGNHATDAGELSGLAANGIASLAVGYTEVPYLDAQGNLHLERSAATLDDGSSVAMTDVYFNVAADDAAAAGVTLPTIGQLLGNDANLDGLLAGLGVAPAANGPAAVVDHAFDTGAADAMKQMAALYDQGAIAA